MSCTCTVRIHLKCKLPRIGYEFIYDTKDNVNIVQSSILNGILQLNIIMVLYNHVMIMTCFIPSLSMSLSKTQTKSHLASWEPPFGAVYLGQCMNQRNSLHSI